MLARRACDQSEHGLPATAATAAIAPVTLNPSRLSVMVNINFLGQISDFVSTYFESS